ncbi:carboxylesterase/lipase family protein [Deinococcus sp.]|uniref:carboxylesterase/lipase family protein n=1 Tax=Deinococcus sp. TaxID=47478 RepID=UPI003B58F43D
MRLHSRLLALLGLYLFPALAQTVSAQTPAPPAPPSPLSVPAEVNNDAYKPAPGPIVQGDTRQGPVAGRQANGVNRFLGIPYAAPPVGELRWKAPQPALAWPGRRDASRLGNACPQRPNAITGNPDRTISGSEDCLYLNVYAPESAVKAPVMVWVHGGSFDTGTGNIYDGSVLARDYGVIVVTLNYRLGVLGWLAAPVLGQDGGNNGLKDVQAALNWVRSNIAGFGGDAGNVTAFGESAGGMILCNLLTSPASRGLFDKAILQSGPCTPKLNTISLPQALDVGERFTAELRCPPGEAECLRRASVAELMGIPVPGSRPPNAIALPPIWGDDSLPREPGAAFRAGPAVRVPVMIGSNRDEGTVFTGYLAGPGRDLGRVLYQGLIAVLNLRQLPAIAARYPADKYPTTGLAAAAVVTDALFACPVNRIAGQLSGSVPTYAYEFADPQAATELEATRSAPNLGSSHASELVYVFGTPITGLADPAKFSPAQQTLSRQMGAYWTNFARSGNPNGAGLGEWPKFDVRKSNVLTFRPGGNAVGSSFAAVHQCRFWDGLDGR